MISDFKKHVSKRKFFYRRLFIMGLVVSAYLIVPLTIAFIYFKEFIHYIYVIIYIITIIVMLPYNVLVGKKLFKFSKILKDLESVPSEELKFDASKGIVYVERIPYFRVKFTEQERKITELL